MNLPDSRDNNVLTLDGVLLIHFDSEFTPQLVTTSGRITSLSLSRFKWPQISLEIYLGAS